MPSFSKIVAFGDGLSDGGHFGKLTQNKYPPSPPFYKGRWTNGPTWVELLAEQSGLTLPEEENYAQGGATTGAWNINEPLRSALGLDAGAKIQGVAQQVEEAVHHGIDPQALHVIWAGGHDIGSYLDYGQPDLIAQPPALNIRQAIETLADAGARYFFLGNMPNMANTPAYAGTENAARAAELVDTYNTGLAQMAAELRTERNIQIIEFDGAAAFAEIAMNASNYGIKYLNEAFLPIEAINFQSPLESGDDFSEQRKNEQADEYFTFWAVSASATVHRILARKALETIQKASR